MKVNSTSHHHWQHAAPHSQTFHLSVPRLHAEKEVRCLENKQIKTMTPQNQTHDMQDKLHMVCALVWVPEENSLQEVDCSGPNP